MIDKNATKYELIRNDAEKLHEVTLMMCGLCLAGGGGECHSPGCAFWINRAPDMPLAYVMKCEPPHKDAWTPDRIMAMADAPKPKVSR